MQRLKRILDYIASIAVIVLLGIIAFSMLSGRFGTKPAVPQQIRSDALQIGQQLKSLPGVSYSNARHTLLFFVHSRCVSCIQSIPDTRKLQAAVARAKDVQAVGLFAGEAESDIQTFRDMGFALPTMKLQSFDAYQVAATPTIILVDSFGNVEELWIGKLESRSLERLIAKLANTESTRG